MEQLMNSGICLAFRGACLAGLGFLWRVSIYDKVKSPKEKGSRGFSLFGPDNIGGTSLQQI